MVLLKNTGGTLPLTGTPEAPEKVALFGVGQIRWKYLLCSWGITALILLIGLLLFSHVERTFLDTV